MKTVIIVGIEYKIGLRGKVFKKVNDDWLLSEKSASEVMAAIAKARPNK